MKRAIFIYSKISGHGLNEKKVAYIKDRLEKIFDPLEIYQTTPSLEDMVSLIHSKSDYDAIIIGGGDGLFNKLASAISDMDKRPTIGYINSGTLCDIGRNFGINGNIKKALDVIEAGNTKSFDAVKLNDNYFFYMSAAGAFSSVSYKVRQKEKRKIGRFSYYFASIKDLFKRTKVKGRIEYDSKVVDFASGFIMCLSGKHVGGFKVNDGEINDGIVELYLPKDGPFHGIVPIIFKSKKTVILRSNEFKIEFDNEQSVIVDGEEVKCKSANISVLNNWLNIYSKK